MTKMNPVGRFDIYMDDLDRAVAFFEAVLGGTLDPMGDLADEMLMMKFPAEIGAYGAGAP